MLSSYVCNDFLEKSLLFLHFFVLLLFVCCCVASRRRFHGQPALTPDPPTVMLLCKGESCDLITGHPRPPIDRNPDPAGPETRSLRYRTALLQLSGF